MAVGGLFKLAQRALFSKPTPEKQLLKLAQGQPVRRIVEIGIDSLDSSQRLISTLVKASQGQSVAYTAIDLFDERPTGAEPLSLATAYRQLAPVGASVRLLPGGVISTLRCEANSLGDTDLLLIARETRELVLEQGGFYLPRMCHPGTLVCQRIDGETADDPGEWQTIPLDEVARRAVPSARAAA